MNVKRTERGWAGHFICANRCMFRRNTLLEHGDIKIVVSTVGLMPTPQEYKKLGISRGDYEPIGLDRHYETMAFHSNPADTRYHDADVTRRIYFESPWAISEVDADDQANIMHDMVVEELTERLEKGDPLPTCYEEASA